MSFVLRFWIVAWMFAPTHTKNLPLITAATEPTAVMEGSEFDKAFAVVNAMYEQIARIPGRLSSGDNARIAADSQRALRDRSSPTEATKETPTPSTLYIKAKDSDFILIDPLDDDDRNAAALSKSVQGSYKEQKESQEQSPAPVLSTDSGEDHDVAATEDSKEQDEDPHGDRTEGEGDPEEDEEQEDEPEQPEDDQGGEDEEDPPPRHSRAKQREIRDAEEEEEGGHEGAGAPIEGAPVTEEDLDDFAPETFMPPTVLGVARHYKVGSSFSVFPVHIPNAPEHIELGSGVPNESQEEEDEDGEEPPAREIEEEEHPAQEDGEEEEAEEMEPHSTTSSDYVIIAPQHDEEGAPFSSSKKGHRVLEHGDDEFDWIGDGGEFEEDTLTADGDEWGEHDGEAQKFKKGSEKSNRYNQEDGAKNSKDLDEFYDEGKHHHDDGREEDDGGAEYDKYGGIEHGQGFHDHYNFDKRTSKNRFYDNLRKKGDYKGSGEDEHSFYKNVEGDEAGSFGKFKEGKDDSGYRGRKKDGESSKESDEWKKSKDGGEEDETSSRYDKGKNTDTDHSGYFSWKD